MTKNKVLVLEDDPNRHRQFKDRFAENGNVAYTIVESADLCIALLEQQEYDIVFLDHDLGGKTFVETREENSGSGVARWIKQNDDKIPGNPFFIIHSLNPIGADLMYGLISSVREGQVYRIPFVWDKSQFHTRINLPKEQDSNG